MPEKPAFTPPPLKKGKSAPNVNRSKKDTARQISQNNNKPERPQRYRPPLYRANSAKITQGELSTSSGKGGASSLKLNKGKFSNNAGPPSPLTRGHSCRITKNELLLGRVTNYDSSGPPSPVYENGPPKLGKGKKQRSNRNLVVDEENSPPKLEKAKKKGSNRNLVDGEQREKKEKPLRDGAGKLLDLKKEAMVII